MSMLIEPYDAVLFDLDGVVYLGPHPVPHAPESINDLRARGKKIGFVTNNAARSPQTVADHLNELGITCNVTDVVASSQAICQLMVRELGEGARVFVCGSDALADEARKVGFEIVDDHTGHPDAVVQGYDPALDWWKLDEAAWSIQRGAIWYASNTDMTRPSVNGLVPGAGSQLAALDASVESDPIVAGKPYPPLLNETVTRLETKRPIFVGDRIDTDVEGANNVNMDSFFVFTGVHGKHDLASAPAIRRPTAIGDDLRDMTKPMRVAIADGDAFVCRDARAVVQDGHVVIVGPLDTMSQQLDALWAVLNLVWTTRADYTDALRQLDRVP